MIRFCSWRVPAGVPMAMTHTPRPYHLQSDGRRHCAAGCCGHAVTSRLGMSSMRPSPHFGANGLGTADASYLAAVASPVGPNWPYMPYIIIYCHITLKASSELMYSKLSLSLCYSPGAMVNKQESSHTACIKVCELSPKWSLFLSGRVGRGCVFSTLGPSERGHAGSPP